VDGPISLIILSRFITRIAEHVPLAIIRVGFVGVARNPLAMKVCLTGGNKISQ
jgi:hypothetical protein